MRWIRMHLSRVVLRLTILRPIPVEDAVGPGPIGHGLLGNRERPHQ